MRFRALPLTAIGVFCVIAALACPGARAQSTIQAELMADLRAPKVQLGSTVFARVLADWHAAGCTLRDGSVLEAHVVSLTPYNKSDKTSEMGLAFSRAQCVGREVGSFTLVLAAIAAPPDDVNLGVLNNTIPIGYGGVSDRMAALSTVRTPSSHFSIDQPGTTHLPYDFKASDFQDPLGPTHSGEVSGIKGLKLRIAVAPQLSAVLSMKGRELYLQRHTLLVLLPMQPADSTPQPAGPAASAPAVPASANALPPPAGTAAPAPPGSQPQPSTVAEVTPVVTAPPAPPAPTTPVPPPDDFDRCAPPECGIALPSADILDSSKPATGLSIHQFGYAPRPQKVLLAFDNDEALAWLGPHSLLVAFNPHVLVPRHNRGPAGSTVRLIRAVLLDTATRQVTRTIDWELPDDREFLWPLPNGAVLVHVGSELRVYGEGLKILRRISLDGPLSFLRITPDGRYISIGIIRERHSPELHAQLRENLNADPEEDLDVLVFDRNFNTIARSASRSGMMPPTLLNEGQASLLALPEMHYRISLHTWDNSTSTLAHFTSSCSPELTSLAPDLIFLVSCEKQSQTREYRVLRSNGKLALRADSTPKDCGAAALGSAGPGTYVVKTVQSALPLPPGGPFSEAILSSEELAVYRAADGRRLLDVRVGSPSSSRDGYALSPDGSQLAVLTREQISLYSVSMK
jgi:hypothetical protein